MSPGPLPLISVIPVSSAAYSTQQMWNQDVLEEQGWEVSRGQKENAKKMIGWRGT